MKSVLFIFGIKINSLLFCGVYHIIICIVLSEKVSSPLIAHFFLYKKHFIAVPSNGAKRRYSFRLPSVRGGGPRITSYPRKVASTSKNSARSPKN